MTDFVAVVTTVRGSAPAVSLTPAWVDLVGQQVVRYLAQASGGRANLSWTVHEPEELPLSQAEKDALTPAQLVDAVRAEAADQGRPVADTAHLVVLINDPGSGSGVTETDPVIAAKDFTAALLAHELGHFFQQAAGNEGSHANSLPGFSTVEYQDPTCIMGAEGGKYSFADPVLTAWGPPPGHDVAGPLMCPPMADRAGWLDRSIVQAVLDLTGLVPFGAPLRTWAGAPPAGSTGSPMVILGRGYLPHGDELYVSLREPSGWDAGFPTDAARTGTLVVQELTAQGGSLLLATCPGAGGNSIRLGRGPLRIDVLGGDTGHVRLQFVATGWRTWKALAGAAFAPATRIAAVARGDLIDVFAVGEDGLVRTITYLDGAWRQWQVLDGAGFAPGAGIAAASTSPDSIDLFVVGLDDQIRQHRLGAGGWEPAWPVIDGGFLGQESALAAAAGDGVVELFATDRERRIVHATVTGGVRGSWEVLPPPPPWVHWAPSIAANPIGDGSVQVHAVTDSHLDDKIFTLTSRREEWPGPWVPHGFQTFPPTAGIAAVSPADGRATLVAADNPLLAQDFAGGAWTTPWGRVDGLQLAADSSTAAASREPGSMEVFAVGADHQVHVLSRSADPDFVPANRQLLRSYPAVVLSSAERFLSAQPDGAILADRFVIGPWETFTVHELEDLSGGARTQLVVAVQAHTGQYLSAENGGGKGLWANRPWFRDWEMFRMYPAAGSPGKVTFQALGGHLWCAEGGGDSVVNCTRTSAGSWETFTVLPL